MSREQYWELLEQARDSVNTDDADTIAEAFINALAEHEPECLARAWQTHHDILMDAYTWPMWGAAHLIMGGCSDTSFEYFRSWLITRGRDAFDEVLDDPDSLVDFLPADAFASEDFECEDLAGAPEVAYERVTGEQMEQHRDVPDVVEVGEEFDFDDDAEMQSRYPRLFARLRSELAA